MKTICEAIKLVCNIMYFTGLVLFGICWITWGFGVELFIKLRGIYSKIDSPLVICFAALIYFEAALFFYAKAQLN